VLGLGVLQVQLALELLAQRWPAPLALLEMALLA
jgi:hypothetical protein